MTRPFIVAIREATGKERMTTYIRGLDLDRGLVQTENSLYALGNRSKEPISQLRIDFTGAVLTSWGLSGYLGIS